ncbi:unnamed protein product, partial [Mesorhabditis spiculigera]
MDETFELKSIDTDLPSDRTMSQGYVNGKNKSGGHITYSNVMEKVDAARAGTSYAGNGDERIQMLNPPRNNLPPESPTIIVSPPEEEMENGKLPIYDPHLNPQLEGNHPAVHYRKQKSLCRCILCILGLGATFFVIVVFIALMVKYL